MRTRSAWSGVRIAASGLCMECIKLLGIVKYSNLGYGQLGSFEKVRPLVGQFDDRFSEKGVGPCEPISGDYLGVVDGEGLMDQVIVGLGLQTRQALSNLIIIGGGEDLGDECEWPNCTRICVRAADASEMLVLVIIGILG